MQKAATVLDAIRKRGDYRARGRDHWRARCWETSTAGSGSDKWKRAQSDWVPRQLSTSLGEGPTEKDPHRGHLAGGLLYSWVTGLSGRESARRQEHAKKAAAARRRPRRRAARPA